MLLSCQTSQLADGVSYFDKALATLAQVTAVPTSPEIQDADTTDDCVYP